MYCLLNGFSFLMKSQREYFSLVTIAMKIVVFDLDETLGYFTQYGIFWDSLLHYVKVKTKQPLTQSIFNDTLDLFPEFLRPNIVHILQYLKSKKKSNSCHKMMIYTNNTGPREWARHIVTYFEDKVHSKLIDQIIAAFKVNGKRVEICRTSHAKNHSDLIKCSKIPIDTEICFMDDTFYPNMAHDNIYYINIKPYYYDLSFDYMLKSFVASSVGQAVIQDDIDDFMKLMNQHIKLFNYVVVEKDPKEYAVDVVLGKHIIGHLHSFFNRPNKAKTIKRMSHAKNKTVKHGHIYT